MSLPRGAVHDERGFTFLELMVAMMLFGILVTLSAGALKNYWYTQALRGAELDVVAQMKQVQGRTVSESHPLVFGVRFDPGSKSWWVVRFDPKNPGLADDTCAAAKTLEFGSGVRVASATFEADAYITGKCRSALGAPADDAFAFFYARGSASPGSVVLEQPTIGKTRTVTLAGVTGRVTGSGG